MARLPRIIVPGVPHHVTQRGNRRQRVFLEEGDYAVYLNLMAQACHASGVEVWSYCLMPNHVHLAMVPATREGLSRAVGETHRRYSAYINARLRVTGHLFQGRFGCVAMDDAHFLAAVRYIAMNPVKARLVERPQAWRWSSTRALLEGRDDALVSCAPVLDRTGDFGRFLGEEDSPAIVEELERGLSVGRPLMGADRLLALERELGIPIAPRKRGPRPTGGAFDGQGKLV